MNENPCTFPILYLMILLFYFLLQLLQLLCSVKRTSAHTNCSSNSLLLFLVLSTFKESGPSAAAIFQGAFHLTYIT